MPLRTAGNNQIEQVRPERGNIGLADCRRLVRMRMINADDGQTLCPHLLFCPYPIARINGIRPRLVFPGGGIRRCKGLPHQSAIMRMLPDQKSAGFIRKGSLDMI